MRHLVPAGAVLALCDHPEPKNREHYVYLWKTPLKKVAAK